MKRCPQCRRDYTDETLNFCLDDGSELLDGPASMDEAATALFPNNHASGDAPISENRSTDPDARLQRRRAVVYAGIGVAVLVIAGTALTIYKPWRTAERETRPIQIERLTTNGRATSAAISPDGKYVIYGVDEGGKDSLWLRQVATSSNVQIFPSAEDVFYWGLTFTPDSNYINFIRAEFEKNVPWGLNQMPVLGGTQKQLMTGIDGSISYSPDGKRFAFIWDEHPTSRESSLMIANADGTGERVIASRTLPETFPSRQTGPAWSPDGKTIACIVADETTVLRKMDIVEVDVNDGTVRPIRTQDWKYIDQIAWLPDKSGLLVVGSDRVSSSYENQIWLFSYPGGAPRRITTDLNDYRSMSLNADATILVTVQSSLISNIWTAAGDIDRAVQVRAGSNNAEGIGGVAVAPDGRVLFYSRASGGDDIWIMNPDGSEAKQLTSDGKSSQPIVTPDGQFVVYVTVRDFQANLWRMRLDGSEKTQLTSGNGDYVPDVSPDSRWVVYTSETSGESSLLKVPIEGGQPVRLSENSVRVPQVSPDGKWIVCAWRKDENSTWRYAILPFEGGEPVRVFDLIGKKGPFRWAADSRSLYYLRDTQGGVTNIWNLPLERGEPRQVTDYKAESILDFAWSANGKWFAMSKGLATSDVVLLRGL